MKQTLKTLLARASHFRGDGTVGSVEAFAGIRNRWALWLRASRLTRHHPDNTFANHFQVEIDCAMNRCRRLAGLRAYRAQNGGRPPGL